MLQSFGEWQGIFLATKPASTEANYPAVPALNEIIMKLVYKRRMKYASQLEQTLKQKQLLQTASLTHAISDVLPTTKLKTRPASAVRAKKSSLLPPVSDNKSSFR